MQKEMHRGVHAFSNNEITRVIGIEHQTGVSSEIKYLLQTQGEVPVGMVRDTLRASTFLDTNYSIDYIEIYRAPNEDGSRLERIDLVQVKTSEAKIDGRIIMDTLKHHERFLNNDSGPIFLETFKKMEASESEVDALIEALGLKYAGLPQDIWMDALTSDSADPVSDFGTALEKYMEEVKAEPAYIRAPRHVKRAFIEGRILEKTDMDGEQGEIGKKLDERFIAWKDAWLGSVIQGKARSLVGVKSTTVRSVIYPIKGRPIVKEIGNID